jgi:tight adherence protein C
MLIVLGIAFVFGSVLVLLNGLTVRQREVAISVKRAKRYGTRNQREIETRKSVNDRLLGPLAARLAGVTMRLMPKTNPDQVSNRLLAAGLARSLTPQTYLAMKTGFAGMFIVFGFFIIVSKAIDPLFGVMIAFGGSAIGFIAPDFVINSRIRGRKDQMRAELPNLLDLLCVSVEAGLGFDQALVKLNERMEGPLVDEFALVLHEMRIGQSRSAALKNLSERVESQEVSQFARAIIQADQLGIALSRILRVQSQDMRLRRQLAAEEKAMKAPVKMLFPTVIFIFPSMFVVALGPAALGLMKTFAGG